MHKKETGGKKESNIKKPHNYLIGFFLITMLSCDSGIYEEYHSFDSQIWNTDSIIEFSYIISDTTKKYDLSLKLRHSIEYEFQNLFVFLYSKKKDTIEINLADKNGKWLGSGVSDIREVEYNIEKGRVFFRKGEYQLSIEQAMRYGFENKIDNLENVLDIGLIISKNNE